MEFKFRANNKARPRHHHHHHQQHHHYQPPPPYPYHRDHPHDNFNYNHQRPPMSYFAEQAFRVGPPHPDMVRMGQFFPNPSNTRESVLRDLEKQRIRQEIMAEEFERRRELEAEVRREIMLEKELELQSSLFSRSSSFPLNSRLQIMDHPDDRSEEPMQFTRISEPKITEVKSSPEIHGEKRGRIIILPKPEVNVSGLKRKAPNPPATSATMPSANLMKKPKEELRCELCQVSATSELAMKEHLNGKKHKSKEARQSSQITGKNFAIGLFSRKNVNNAKDEAREQEEKQKEVVLEEKPNDIHANESDDDDCKKDGTKFAFWCSVCKIGAFSEKVMNNHKKGKKHTSRILETLYAREGEASKKENNVEIVSEKEVKEEILVSENTNVETGEEAGTCRGADDEVADSGCN